MLENLHFTSTGILKKGAEEEETLLWHAKNEKSSDWA